MFDYLSYGENGAVKFWIGRVVGKRVIAEVEMASNVATGFGKD